MSNDTYSMVIISIGPCRCKSENSRETLRQAVQKILNLKYGKLFYSAICSCVLW